MEAEVIIISCVRTQFKLVTQSDAKYKLGFIGMPKRLNVALSRPKSLLIVLGNANLLQARGPPLHVAPSRGPPLHVTTSYPLPRVATDAGTRYCRRATRRGPSCSRA